TVRANASACGLPPPTNNEGDGRRRRGAARRGEQLVATVPAGRRARGSRCGEGEGTIHAIPQCITSACPATFGSKQSTSELDGPLESRNALISLCHANFPFNACEPLQRLQ
ncbi:Os07g0654800, partial [Oryza sativa Japonica Group]